MQIINPAKVYPVIIIGSGASGGMAAWNLTRKGIDVLVLDAGQKFDRSKLLDARPPLGGARAARARRGAAAVLPRHARSSPTSRRPSGQFDLTRVWGHGGKTNVWGRVSLRLSDLDFKGAETRRLGDPVADRLQGHRARTTTRSSS